MLLLLLLLLGYRVEEKSVKVGCKKNEQRRGFLLLYDEVSERPD